MTDQHASRPEDGVADVAVQEHRRRFSIVWIIPIFVILIGGWLVYTTLAEQGPTITIDFKTAEGLEAGKTKVKFKDVEIGLVESVTIKPDLSGVVVTASFSKEVEPHLTAATLFWVVRPRLGAGGVSGIGTLVSGAYVEMDPVGKGASAREFIGLEDPPVVRSDTRGRKFDLVADRLGSYTYGSPIYFRGFKAGQVFGYELAEDNKSVTMHIFVNEPYDALVRDNSRFWNVSGIHLSVDANGIDLRTESLESLVQGGIAFDVPTNLETAQQAEEGRTFPLYENEEALEEGSYVERERVIAYFDGAIRGLSVDAPVEFRGIKVGSVIDIKVEFDWDEMVFRIPVLIELQPGRVSVSGERFEDAREQMQALIDMGLRAQLETGNLLTGQAFVALDLHPETPVRLVGADDRYPEVPTIPSTMEAITTSLSGVLDKVAALPLEELIGDLRQTVESANRLLSSPSAQQSLENLSVTLARAETLMQTLDTEVGPLVSSLRSTSDAAGLAMVQARSTLASAESLTGEQSPLRHDLSSLFEELKRAARSIRVLADYLQNHPEALLGGKTR